MQNDCLRNYLKNIKNIAIETSYEKPPRVVVGNQGCDPDSVVGSVFTSILRTIQESKSLSNFKKEFEALCSTNPPQTSTIIPFLPLINNETNNFVRDKSDLNYLNTTFNLGLEEILPSSRLSSIPSVEITLFDHNLPEKNLQKWAQKAKYIDVVDHHVVSDQSWIKSVPKSDVQQSGSGVSVIARQATNDELDTINWYFPNLMKAACVIILADSSSFKDELKGTRWFEYDEAIIGKMQNICGMSRSETKTHKKAMKEAVFSLDQFKKPFAHLLAEDQKTFGYVLGGFSDTSKLKKGEKLEIVFSTLRNSYENFKKHYGCAMIRSHALQFIEKENAHAVVFMFLCPNDEEEGGSKRDMVVFSKDAPFARAIGQCMINKGLNIHFVFEIPGPKTDDSPMVSYRFVNPSSDVSRKIAEGALRTVLE